MYESGIIDSSFGGGLDCADGCAMLLCSGDSEEPERVREAVLSRAEALLREGIGADYFLRIGDFLLLIISTLACTISTATT